MHWNDVVYLSHMPLRAVDDACGRTLVCAEVRADNVARLEHTVVDPFVVAFVAMRLVRAPKPVRFHGVSLRPEAHTSLRDVTVWRQSEPAISALVVLCTSCLRAPRSNPAAVSDIMDFGMYNRLFASPRVAIFAMEALPWKWLRYEVIAETISYRY